MNHSNTPTFQFTGRQYEDGEAIEYRADYPNWYKGKLKYEALEKPPYWRVITHEDGRGLNMKYVDAIRKVKS